MIQNINPSNIKPKLKKAIPNNCNRDWLCSTNNSKSVEHALSISWDFISKISIFKSKISVLNSKFSVAFPFINGVLSWNDTKY